MPNINYSMTPRLTAVAEMVAKGSKVADIGTDHAYVPVYLVLNKVCNSALAMDINEGPLLRAEENIRKFSLTDEIKTRLSDGLSKLENGDADTVVIAGMGGILINNIIVKDKERLTSVKHYILQPMTAIEETRKFLYNNGFKIIDEKLAVEDEKIYTIISAVCGEDTADSEIDYYIGRCLIKNRDKNLPEYLQGKIYEYEKALNSMEKASGNGIGEKREHFRYLLNEFKRIKEDCAKW